MQASDIELHNKTIAGAEKLHQTMGTNGWTDIVEPLLDKMIQDCIGYKDSKGVWQKANSELSADNLTHYQQALMDFNNHLQNHFFQAEIAKSRLEEPIKDGDYIMPMKDTRYAKEEENVLEPIRQ